MKINEHHLLMNTEAEATAILNRITAGEDFAVIALAEPQYESPDPFFASVNAEYEAAVLTAYNVPIGGISPIMFSAIGFHLIKRL